MSYEPPPHGFRTFTIVWVSQSLSVFGSALTYFACTIWLSQALYPLPEQKPQLAYALAGVTLSFMLPMVILAPLAGAWADRHDRKRTMIAADLLSAAISVVLGVLIAGGRLQLWSLMLVVVLSAAVGSFHGSAFDTSYAMLVPRRLLPRTNGMMQTMWSLSGILSPALAATLIALPGLARQGIIGGAAGGALAGLPDGTALAIFVDAATFLMAAGTLSLLRIPSPARTDLAGPERKSIWADVREEQTWPSDSPIRTWTGTGRSARPAIPC